MGSSSQIMSWSCWNRYYTTVTWWASMRCSSALCLAEALTPFSLFASCSQSTSPPINHSTLPLLTLRKPSTVWSCGGPWRASVSRNMLWVSFRACTRMTRVLCGPMVTVDTLRECISKLKAWKAGIESKGRHINMKYSQFPVFGVCVDALKKSGNHPCAVCHNGVSNNPVECS